jgi:hypothetical protein
MGNKQRDLDFVAFMIMATAICVFWLIGLAIVVFV